MTAKRGHLSRAGWIGLGLGVSPWLALAGGCSQAPDPRMTQVADGAELKIVATSSNAFSDVARPMRVVVYDRGTLALFGIELDDVDFERHMVLIAAMGPAPHEDCAIRIRRVWRDGGRVRVAVEQQYPAADARRRLTSSPLHAVVVPRCELPIERFSSKMPRNAFRDASPSRS
jgi:hypothetical protein